MTSLRAEHGGALAILLVLYVLHIYFPFLALPITLNILIDMSGVVRRGDIAVPKLGIKQQLILDHDLWATPQRLLEALPYKIRWKWVKCH